MSVLLSQAGTHLSSITHWRDELAKIAIANQDEDLIRIATQIAEAQARVWETLSRIANYGIKQCSLGGE